LFPESYPQTATKNLSNDFKEKEENGREEKKTRPPSLFRPILLKTNLHYTTVAQERKSAKHKAQEAGGHSHKRTQKQKKTHTKTNSNGAMRFN
jgi:hypothetical protein